MYIERNFKCIVPASPQMKLENVLTIAYRNNYYDY